QPRRDRGDGSGHGVRRARRTPASESDRRSAEALLLAPMPSSTAALRRRAREHFTSPAKQRGLLVAFEGPDGSGKTTQRKLFKTWLKSQGYDVVTTKWNSSELIKPIIKSRKSVRALSPEEYSLLHGADFRHRVEQVILPALWDGKLVIA